MPRIGIDLVVKHLPARDPDHRQVRLAQCVLVETSSAEDEGTGEALEAWLPQQWRWRTGSSTR